jgi:polygalacturonase
MAAEVVVEAPFPMPAIPVAEFPARDFVVTDFGVQEATATAPDISDAIRRAIKACHDAGGGRVVVPRGRWLTGQVHLRSNVNLHIAEGAVLEFSDDPEDYLPAVQTIWEGIACFSYSPLIYAFDCENVALTGPGTIEARLGTWSQWYARPPARMEALKRLYQMMSTDVPVEQRQLAEGENHLRPHFIQFNRCRRVLIEDVRIRNSPFWTVHLLLCDGAIVRRIDVSAHGHNNDGIETDVLHQWRTLVPAYEERITRIRGVYFRNVTVGETDTPFRILGDADLPVRNVVIENVTVGKVCGAPRRYENVENLEEKDVRLGEQPQR